VLEELASMSEVVRALDSMRGTASEGRRYSDLAAVVGLRLRLTRRTASEDLECLHSATAVVTRRRLMRKTASEELECLKSAVTAATVLR
jgi:hypothetical protein